MIYEKLCKFRTLVTLIDNEPQLMRLQAGMPQLVLDTNIDHGRHVLAHQLLKALQLRIMSTIISKRRIEMHLNSDSALIYDAETVLELETSISENMRKIKDLEESLIISE